VVLMARRVVWVPRRRGIRAADFLQGPLGACVREISLLGTLTLWARSSSSRRIPIPSRFDIAPLLGSSSLSFFSLLDRLLEYGNT